MSDFAFWGFLFLCILFFWGDPDLCDVIIAYVGRLAQ